MTFTNLPFPPHFSPFLLSTTSMPSLSLTTCLVLFLPSFFATLDWQVLSSGATTPQSSIPPNFPPVSIELCSSTYSKSLVLVCVCVCCSVYSTITLLDFYTLHYLSYLKVISEDAHPVTMLDMSFTVASKASSQCSHLCYLTLVWECLLFMHHHHHSLQCTLPSLHLPSKIRGLWKMYLLQ